MVNHWRKEEEKAYARQSYIPDRIAQMDAEMTARQIKQGDRIVERVKDIFYNGLGIQWGASQVKVFNAFLHASLPLIYGDAWAESKSRVIKELEIQNEQMFCLVNMARRNGKTFVTSGTAAALFLAVPNIKIAIFSTCRRTSQMMLNAITDMLEKAFEMGTKVNRQDYQVVSRNSETIVFLGSDGTKRSIGSFPGSVRVSRFNFLFLLGFPPFFFFHSPFFLPSSGKGSHFHLICLFGKLKCEATSGMYFSIT